MKIVVIGGTGLIGTGLVTELRGRGHDVVAASPTTGVNAVTGEGLADALRDASVVVDVSNAPTRHRAAVLEFFETSTRNLLAAGAAAGVAHHVILSVVATDQLAEGPHFGGKLAQEKLVAGSSIPFTIVRATQFFEFLPTIADLRTEGGTVRVPPVWFQPVAAADVVAAVARIALGLPAGGIVDVAGPERVRLDDLLRRDLEARGDPRTVAADPGARYGGAVVGELTLVPGPDALLGETRYDDWAR